MYLIDKLDLFVHIVTLLVVLSGAYYSYRLSKIDKARAFAWTIISLGFLVGFFLHFVNVSTNIFHDQTLFMQQVLSPALSFVVSFAFFYGVREIFKKYRPVSKRPNKMSLFSMISSVIVFLGGLVVLFGWIYGLPLLTSLTPWFPTMKINTAIAFILCGITLFLISCFQFKNSPIIRRTIAFFAIAVTLTILSSLFVNTGLELVGDSLVAKKPSWGTFACFIVFSFGALNYNLIKKNYRTTLYSGIFMVAMSSLAILGYILNMPVLYYNTPNLGGGMAIHTAVFFMLLGLSLINLSNKK